MSDTITDTHGKSVNRLAMMLVLLVGVFSVMLMQTSLGTAQPALMKAFDVNASTVQWLTTIFLMANGIMVPVSAFLTTRIPTKTLYLSALSLFTAGTFLAFMTPTNAFWLLMVARVLQAMAVGVLMPLMQVVSLTLFDAESRGKAMGLGDLVWVILPLVAGILIIAEFMWHQSRMDKPFLDMSVFKNRQF
ncbi:MFS transporter, partial [Leuconostoc mesenteroides subsp. mesenteroides]|uniref:MFS transporter n=1 Tax=Leuconostoc mesenteroides TaxID=1245 RepID=UPI000A0BEA31